MCCFGSGAVWSASYPVPADICTNCPYPEGVNGAGQSAAGYDIRPQAAMEMLSTCDGRLQALMAEANLLGEAYSSSQADISPEDAELRQAFASTLIESGMRLYTHAALIKAWRTLSVFQPSIQLLFGCIVLYNC